MIQLITITKFKFARWGGAKSDDRLQHHSVVKKFRVNSLPRTTTNRTQLERLFRLTGLWEGLENIKGPQCKQH